MSMMNPVAGPSGPGKFSTRTDLPPSKEYGERKQTEEIMQGAPTAKTRGAADPKLGRPANPMTPVTPLFSPSTRPEEPITAGIDMGAGPGSEILGMRQPDDTNFRANISAYMPVLTYIASQPDTSPETRQVIRELRDML